MVHTLVKKSGPGNKREIKEDGVGEKYELRSFKRVCILIFGARPLDAKKTFGRDLKVFLRQLQPRVHFPAS